MLPDLQALHPDAGCPECPYWRLLDLIADKWTVMAVYALAAGRKRHGQLKRELGGISQKMLTQTLRALEQEGMVERTVHPVVPPMVEYALTARGETMIELLGTMLHWAKELGEEQMGLMARTARSDA